MKMLQDDYYYYSDDLQEDNEILPLDMSTTSVTPNQYTLRWNNHRTNLLNAFESLLHQQAFTDVSLACVDGITLHAHRLVLAACSIYFAELFGPQPAHHHPIVVLRDVKSSDMRSLLMYMYKGEVNVEKGDLKALLRAANGLRVKGLVEDIDVDSQYQLEPIPLVTSSHQRGDRSLTPVSIPSMSRASTPVKTKDHHSMSELEHFYPTIPHHPFNSFHPPKRSHGYSESPSHRNSISPTPRHPLQYPFIHSPRLFPMIHPPLLSSPYDDPTDLRTSKDISRSSRPSSPVHKNIKPTNHPPNSCQELTPSPSIPGSPPPKRSRSHDPLPLMSPPPLLPRSLGQHVPPSHGLSPDVSTLVSLANSMMPLPSISSQLLPSVPLSGPEMNPLRPWETQSHPPHSKTETVSEWMERRMEIIQQNTSPLLQNFNLNNIQKNEPVSDEEGSPYTDIAREEDSQEKFNVGSLLPDFSNNYPLDSKSQLSSFVSGYVSAPKPEWKRYKQYSKTDLMEAIEAVKSGMTALMASRKFKVPSRTLYDKIKKMGINTVPRRITHKKSPTLTDLEREQCFRDALSDPQLPYSDYRHTLKTRLTPYGKPLYHPEFKMGGDKCRDVPTTPRSAESLDAAASPHTSAEHHGRPRSHDSSLNSSHSPHETDLFKEEKSVELPRYKHSKNFNSSSEEERFTNSKFDMQRRPPSIEPLLSPSKIPQIPLTILDPPRINRLVLNAGKDKINSLTEKCGQYRGNTESTPTEPTKGNIKKDWSESVAISKGDSRAGDVENFRQSPPKQTTSRGSFVVEAAVLKCDKLQEDKNIRNQPQQIEEMA